MKPLWAKAGFACFQVICAGILFISTGCTDDPTPQDSLDTCPTDVSLDLVPPPGSYAGQQSVGVSVPTEYEISFSVNGGIRRKDESLELFPAATSQFVEFTATCGDAELTASGYYSIVNSLEVALSPPPGHYREPISVQLLSVKGTRIEGTIRRMSDDSSSPVTEQNSLEEDDTYEIAGHVLLGDVQLSSFAVTYSIDQTTPWLVSSFLAEPETRSFPVGRIEFDRAISADLSYLPGFVLYNDTPASLLAFATVGLSPGPAVLGNGFFVAPNGARALDPQSITEAETDICICFPGAVYITSPRSGDSVPINQNLAIDFALNSAFRIRQASIVITPQLWGTEQSFENVAVTKIDASNYRTTVPMQPEAGQSYEVLLRLEAENPLDSGYVAVAEFNVPPAAYATSMTFVSDAFGNFAFNHFVSPASVTELSYGVVTRPIEFTGTRNLFISASYTQFADNTTLFVGDDYADGVTLDLNFGSVSEKPTFTAVSTQVSSWDELAIRAVLPQDVDFSRSSVDAKVQIDDFSLDALEFGFQDARSGIFTLRTGYDQLPIDELAVQFNYTIHTFSGAMTSASARFTFVLDTDSPPHVTRQQTQLLSMTALAEGARLNISLPFVNGSPLASVTATVSNTDWGTVVLQDQGNGRWTAGISALTMPTEVSGYVSIVAKDSGDSPIESLAFYAGLPTAIAAPAAVTIDAEDNDVLWINNEAIDDAYTGVLLSVTATDADEEYKVFLPAALEQYPLPLWTLPSGDYTVSQYFFRAVDPRGSTSMSNSFALSVTRAP